MQRGVCVCGTRREERDFYNRSKVGRGGGGGGAERVEQMTLGKSVPYFACAIAAGLAKWKTRQMIFSIRAKQLVPFCSCLIFFFFLQLYVLCQSWFFLVLTSSCGAHQSFRGDSTALCLMGIKLSRELYLL